MNIPGRSSYGDRNSVKRVRALASDDSRDLARLSPQEQWQVVNDELTQELENKLRIERELQRFTPELLRTNSERDKRRNLASEVIVCANRISILKRRRATLHDEVHPDREALLVEALKYGRGIEAKLADISDSLKKIVDKL